MFYQRFRYKERRYPENNETLTIQNTSPLEADVTFCFLEDSKGETFLLDPPSMLLKSGESQVSCHQLSTSRGLALERPSTAKALYSRGLILQRPCTPGALHSSGLALQESCTPEALITRILLLQWHSRTL